MSHHSEYLKVQPSNENFSITLEQDYQVEDVKVYLNGLRLFEKEDYTVEGATVTLNNIRLKPFNLIVDYIKGDS